MQNHAGMNTHELQRGFTLVELVTAIAILAVLVALAAPSAVQAWNQAAAQRAYHAMSSSLALARVQAVSRGHAVTVCPSLNGTSCIVGGTDWSQGWIVYLDPSRSPQPESTSDVIEMVPDLAPEISLRTSAGRHRIRYQPSGWAAGSNLRLTLCIRSTGFMHGSILLSNAGRTRVERAAAETSCSA